MSEPMRGKAAPWPLYADGNWHVLGVGQASGYKSVASMASAAALWASSRGYRCNSRTVATGTAIKLTRRDGQPQQAYWPTREKDAQDKYGIRGGPTRAAVGGLGAFEVPPVPRSPKLPDPAMWGAVSPPPVVGALASSTLMPDGSLELVTILGPDQVAMLRKALEDGGDE